MMLRSLIFPMLLLIGNFNLMAQEDVPTGKKNRKFLMNEPHKTWFEAGYKDYKIDEGELKSINQSLNDLKILIFLGTWCEDSQREVPRFFKILDYFEKPPKVELIFVDLNKEEPKNRQKDFQIEFVPTVIVLDGENELGRIVERPKRSLESDLVEILSSDN